jgi:hypothetical protein
MALIYQFLQHDGGNRIRQESGGFYRIQAGHLSAANRFQKVIDTLTGQNTRACSDLEPSTENISANRVLDHTTYGNSLVFVDTPGLDKAPEIVKKWMENM